MVLYGTANNHYAHLYNLNSLLVTLHSFERFAKTTRMCVIFRVKQEFVVWQVLPIEIA